MSKLYLDTSAASSFACLTASIVGANVERITEGSAPAGASLPALVTGDKTVSGGYAVAAELAKANCATLLGSGDEVEKEVTASLVDVQKTVAGDMKASLGALHKLNKKIQDVTFLVKNVFTLADIALFVVLKGKINNWAVEERVALVSICRWYDNVQHLPAVAKALPGDAQVAFALEVPKPVVKTGAKVEKKPAEKKENEASGAEAKKTGGGDKKGAEAKKAGGGDKKAGAEKVAEKKQETGAGAAASSSGPNPDAELHRVDFRVGRIVECQKHPDADSLYVEKIDLGEESGPRTIVSGLVKFVPLDQMLNRLVVVVANLKPAKLKGILSAGMVLAASNADHTQVEILDPPAGAKPGERITFPGITGEPDAQLNPKKKIFEEVKPHLHTNADKIAQYKELTFTTSAGPCTVATLASSSLG